MCSAYQEKRWVLLMRCAGAEIDCMGVTVLKSVGAATLLLIKAILSFRRFSLKRLFQGTFSRLKYLWHSGCRERQRF